jgi:hypothetical protein
MLSARMKADEEFVFIGAKPAKPVPLRPTVTSSALMPTLYGLAVFIKYDEKDGGYTWKVPFEDVKAAWDLYGGRWLRDLQDSNDGGEPMYVGRDVKNYMTARYYWTAQLGSMI